jgi:excisionase family DNA binding protein
VSGLNAIFAPEIVEGIERLVDERVEAKIAEATIQPVSPWLTIEQAVEYLHVSERLLYRLLKSGRIRSTTLGRRRLLHRDDLDAFAREGAARR